MRSICIHVTTFILVMDVTTYDRSSQNDTIEKDITNIDQDSLKPAGTESMVSVTTNYTSGHVKNEE